MTDAFTKPFADLLQATQFAQLPAHAQTLIHDGLAKTREATLKTFVTAKDGAAAFGKANPIATDEAKVLTATVFDHAIANTEAAFIAAQAIAQAKSPTEVAQLQAKFVQTQFAKAGEQTKELFELSTKAAQKTAEALTGLASKSLAQYKA
jgi:hypothetical protein